MKVLTFSQDSSGPRKAADPVKASEGVLRVDLNKLLAGRLAVQSNSGSGKSWLLRTQLGATKLSSRTKAGLERVRAQGKTLGRPGGFALHGPILVRMKAEGYSQGRMSRGTGLAVNTVKRYLARLEVATP